MRHEGMSLPLVEGDVRIKSTRSTRPTWSSPTTCYASSMRCASASSRPARRSFTKYRPVQAPVEAANRLFARAV